MLFTLRSSANRLRAASHDPRINGPLNMLPAFIILIHYIWFSDVAFMANQRRYPPDQNISVVRFFWLISSCPITVVFVRSQMLFGTFFFLLHQPLSDQ
jgi:hypothetical protein